MALLNEINVKGVPHPIVTDDGYYQEMTVGDAEQLVATTFTEDDAPYNFRTAGGAIDIGDRKQVEGIVGGTIAWNQQINPSGYNTQTVNGVTMTKNDDGSVTFSGTATADASFALDNTWDNPLVKGRVYYVHACPENGGRTTYYGGVAGLRYDFGDGAIFKHSYDWGTTDVRLDVASGATINGTVYPQFIDLTQMFGSTIADYIYTLEQANAGAGVAWFKKYFPKPYYAYNAGQLMSVKALRHKTVGFNQFDIASATQGKRFSVSGEVIDDSDYYISDYIKVVPNTTYYFKNVACSYRTSSLGYFDANKTLLSLATINNGTEYYASGIKTMPSDCAYVRVVSHKNYVDGCCVNLHWDGERDGEYEEYVEHIYELDSDLELRGIPKLSAGNDLYYDGDVYEPDGTVTRKYGIVDLGTLGWVKYSSPTYDNLFYAAMPTMRPTPSAYEVANILCVNYKTTTQARIGTSGYTNKYISGGAVNVGSARFWLNDEAYTEASAIKSALNGVMAVYELATPTTETADPYNGTQIVDDFGTEEFIDAGVAAETPTRDVAIPVGHNSLYQPNLRAKLEMVPEAPEDNGYYVVYHHDGINEYVPLIIPQELPDLPTEDGTYTLKCTVASGSATLSFESEV